jgi:hypothetical protein
MMKPGLRALSSRYSRLIICMDVKEAFRLNSAFTKRVLAQGKSLALILQGLGIWNSKVVT